jgi:hypothetical protein
VDSEWLDDCVCDAVGSCDRLPLCDWDGDDDWLRDCVWLAVRVSV